MDINKMSKWENGSDPEGKVLILKMPMHLDIITSEKKNGDKRTFEQLAQLGSRFGGVEIGTDHEGRRIMANISIYRKPVQVSQGSRNTPIAVG